MTSQDEVKERLIAEIGAENVYRLFLQLKEVERQLVNAIDYWDERFNRMHRDYKSFNKRVEELNIQSIIDEFCKPDHELSKPEE